MVICQSIKETFDKLSMRIENNEPVVAWTYTMELAFRGEVTCLALVKRNLHLHAIFSALSSFLRGNRWAFTHVFILNLGNSNFIINWGPGIRPPQDNLRTFGTLAVVVSHVRNFLQRLRSSSFVFS